MPEPLPVVWTTRYAPAKQEEIERVEAAWHIRFPADFLEIARPYHGGHPAPDSPYLVRHIIDLSGGDDTVLNNLLTFEREDRYYIVRTWGAIFDYLPARVFPFAEDSGGSYFAFDYRDTPAEPTILFLDHECLTDDGYFTQVPLTTTFTEFVALLRYDPELIDEDEIDQ
jgi:hypothetical protein